MPVTTDSCPAPRSSASVAYRRDERAAGRSKYPIGKMIKLSIDSVTGFSTAPLRAATWLGLIGGAAALATMAYALIAMAMGNTLPGWTSMVVAVAGVGAVQLLCLGILGEYVGRMYAHLQARPTYFVAYDSLQAAGRHSPEPGADDPVRLAPSDVHALDARHAGRNVPVEVH
jgi:hypothetical protein